MCIRDSIDIEQLKNYKEEDTVLITTGSQGESMAALSRMASSLHRKVSITPRDVVILSSTPIPGNEKAVARVINELSMKGAKVISQDTHVSGHACQEEIKLIYSLVHPKYAIPIHGEFRHRMAQKELAESLGIPKENIMMLHTGDVLELSLIHILLFQSVQKIRLQGIHLPALGTDGMVMAVARSRLFSVQLIPGETVVKGDLFDHMQFQKDLYGPVYGCKMCIRDRPHASLPAHTRTGRSRSWYYWPGY